MKSKGYAPSGAGERKGNGMRHVSLDPQNVSRSTWYYEDPTHLLLVHEVRTKDGEYIQTEQFKLPWRMIEASRKRWVAHKRKRT
jgi:hypothetical protein